MFPSTERPRFRTGTTVLLALSIVMVFVSALNSLYLHWANQKKARILASRGEQSPGHGEHDGVGDKSLHFKYIT